MQLNYTDKLALGVSKSIKEQLGERVVTCQIYDVVDDANHRAFKIKFIAYNYFVVIFNYELDIIGFSIEVGSGKYISLINEHNCYSDTDMNTYLQRVKNELELRIPDKYLIAHAWK